ncbi:MAG: peptidase MA family metallohydrolase [Candidatus Limnocylindrales bacterium]
MRRLASVLAIVLLVSLAAAPAALAADPTFQPATATATFGTSIDVQQQATLPAGVKRVEALVRAGKGSQTFLAAIQTPAAGPATLRYRYETPFGSLYPNTPVELGFRITLDDGRTVDGPTTTVLYEDSRFAWATLTGAIVRVHWSQGGNTFGQRALDIGERAVEAASALLGVTETEPVDFYIYADRDAFYDVIGPSLPENVGGLAVTQIRTLFANIAPSSVNDPWVGIVVPHELTHLVFDTATRNAYHEPLHWLNEGLADYQAAGYDAGARSNVERAARTGDLMPLRALIGQFPSPPAKFSLAYDESVSAIDFMVRTYGKDALVKLIRSYADGVSDDAAFSAALGVDTVGFENAWLADLGVEAPKPFGPLPAPVGPLPPDWLAGPPATPAPGATGPVATPRPPGPGASGGGDEAGVLLYVGIGIAGLLIVIGLVVVASRFSRGEPFLAPLTPTPARSAEPNDIDEPDRDDDSTLPPDEPPLPPDEPPLPPDGRPAS